MSKLTRPSLAAAVAAEQRPPGTKCTIGLAVAKLTPADVAELGRLMADPDVSSAALARGLSSVVGVKIRDYTMVRHRTGECNCG